MSSMYTTISFIDIMSMLFKMQNHIVQHEHINRMECHIVSVATTPTFSLRVVYDPSYEKRTDQNIAIFDMYQCAQTEYPDVFNNAIITYPETQSIPGQFVFNIHWNRTPPRWFDRVINKILGRNIHG